MPIAVAQQKEIYLQLVIEFIHDNLGKDLRISNLAIVAMMSHYHFARSFKKSMGIAPHRYVVQYRMEWAKQLLTNTQLSVMEISHQVGFSNQSHFTTQFQKVIGTTPKSYRDRS
jgi:AraC family transcriptional regulator